MGIQICTEDNVDSLIQQQPETVILPLQRRAKLRARLIMPRLPSFHVIAMVLSFYGCEYTSGQLLKHLAPICQTYLEKHGQILDGFLAPCHWEPRITRSLQFGEESKSWTVSYPG